MACDLERACKSMSLNDLQNQCDILSSWKVISYQWKVDQLHLL